MADLDTAATEAPIDEAPALDAAIDTAPPAEPTVPELAAKMGWTPKEQWRGSPEKWVPAHEFLEGAVNVNQRLRSDIRAVRHETDKLARSTAAIVERQVAERVAMAEARFNAAVEAGDTQAARAATREIDAARAAAPVDNPEERFAEANPWYGKNDEATAFAVGISQRLASQGKSVSEQLEAAEAGVRKRFPELYDAPPAKGPPAVNAPATRTAAPSNRAKGVNDLPASARIAGEALVKKGYVKDMASYAKEWHAEN